MPRTLAGDPNTGGCKSRHAPALAHRAKVQSLKSRLAATKDMMMEASSEKQALVRGGGGTPVHRPAAAVEVSFP